MESDIKVTLLIPIYNEEKNIQKGVLDKIGNFTLHHRNIVQVSIIDDGSTDDSKKIIRKKYLPIFPKFKLIENNHQGKAFAVMTGIHTADTPFVMFTDADLATPIEEADKLIAGAERGYPIVIGSRNSRREDAPVLRKIQSFGFTMIKRIIIGLSDISDTQCGFKLFETKTAQKIIRNLHVFHNKRKAHGSSVTAGFDLEFLFVAHKFGYRILEVPVVWRHVETKNVSFFKDSIEGLMDILQIKFTDVSGRYSKKA